MLSKIRPREVSESLANDLNNASYKFQERTNKIKFFEWVKARIIENNRELLIYLKGRRGRSNSPESGMERRISRAHFLRKKACRCSRSKTTRDIAKKSRTSFFPPGATTLPTSLPQKCFKCSKWGPFSERLHSQWEEFWKTCLKTGHVGTLSANNEKNDEMTRPVRLSLSLGRFLYSGIGSYEHSRAVTNNWQHCGSRSDSGLNPRRGTTCSCSLYSQFDSGDWTWSLTCMLS